MKKIYNCLLILILAVTVQAQTTSSSCEAVDSLEQFYIFDATKLAIRELYKTKSPDTNAIVVDQSYIDEILKPLLAVHQATELVARDEVIDFYNIHALEAPATNSFVLYADTSYHWTKQWGTADIYTGIESIDIWVDSLELFFPRSPELVYDEALGQTVLRANIQSGQHLNLSPLLNEFLAIDGVLNAETEQYQGEVEKDILYELSPAGDYVDLHYHYGWTNCENGCSNEHFWIFRVNLSDCSVEFRSDGGTPLLINDVSQISQVSISPNPTKADGFTSVKVVGPPRADFFFRMYDAYGQIIESRELGFHNGLINLQLDLSPLPVGVYFITFSHGDQLLTKRVMRN